MPLLGLFLSRSAMLSQESLLIKIVVCVPQSVYSGSWQPSCCYNTVKSQPNKDLPTNKKQVNVALE